MEIREKQNLIQLLMGSFRLINRSIGVVLVYFFLLVLVTFALKLFLPRPIGSLLHSLFLVYFGVVLWRILAAKAENNGESISNSLSASLLPSVYMIVFGLLIGIVMTVFFAIVAFMHLPLKILIIIAWVVGIIVMTCLAFAPITIAIRNQGPIEAALYSWNLASKNFIKILLSLIVTVVFPILVFAAIGYGLYIGIPLFFADSFNLANLSMPWYFVLAGLVILGVFLWLSMQAFILLLFLNLDYGDNRLSHTPEVVKEAQASRNSFAPAPKSKTEQADVITAEDIQNVTITQASIKTEEEHHNHLSEHLDQVYQPKPEDFAQYSAEEDRMPTILFDDDMARQIEENRKMMEQQAQPKKQEDSGDNTFSIKMSK